MADPAKASDFPIYDEIISAIRIIALDPTNQVNAETGENITFEVNVLRAYFAQYYSTIYGSYENVQSALAGVQEVSEALVEHTLSMQAHGITTFGSQVVGTDNAPELKALLGIVETYEKTFGIFSDVYPSTWPIIRSAQSAQNILGLFRAKTESGTCVITVSIDGVPVEGLTNVSILDVEADLTPTDDFSVAEGQTVTLEIVSVDDCVGITLSVGFELTA